MDDEPTTPQSPSTLKHKLKQSLSFSCCSRTHNHHHHHHHKEAVNLPCVRLVKASSTWLKTRAQELPEIKDKCRNIFSKMNTHRRHPSVDFRYDPLSYSLNFEDGFYEDDEATLKNFSARLPAAADLSLLRVVPENGEAFTTAPRAIAAVS